MCSLCVLNELLEPFSLRHSCTGPGLQLGDPVSFQGNMMVYGNIKCNRWYFKFNGNECNGPMTIDAVVYNDWPSGNSNLYHHRSLEGYCENISQGAVRVELWVGQ